MRKKIVLTTAIAATLLISGCNAVQEDKSESGLDSRVHADDHFTGLFMGECGGFTGSDGTYSVLLPDGRTAWIFGDTFIGGVNPDNTRQHQDPIYIRNSVVVQDGDSLRTLFNIINGKRASFAIPPMVLEEDNGVTEDSVWFWPGDGYIQGDQLKLFFSEFIKTGDDMWGFGWNGTWVGSYSLPGLEEINLVRIISGDKTDVHFGHAVLEDKEHIYVYGGGNKQPHVARFTRGDVPGQWEFYTGMGWSNDITQSAPMAEINGSEQFSVLKIESRYILVTQMNGINGDICSFTSDTPYGPWTNKQSLYTPPLPDSAHNLFTYNALAHPQFLENEMLLISYNTNSYELADHFRDATIYRPRFIRAPLNLIDTTLSR
jgi:hypothetical protein